MEPLVTIPQILVFNAPYNRLQSQEMTLINNTEQVLMFKLKTNNAQHYIVKPTVGLVEPYSTSKVLISLCRFDFQPRTCYQHRFIVESFYIPVEGLQQCDREAPKAFFKRTPRSDMGVVRIRVRLEATPALPQKERLADVPAQAVAEPLLDKQPALEEPQKAKRLRGPRSWFLWTLLILAFVVAVLFIGIFRNEDTSKDSSHSPVLDNGNLSI
ncbi:vesicle-associated membrane protein/synaptobrevin-binding protein [Drosophila persimilis]|uniref:vesicle-associated membrane protein/synaptobrevin-binding protein n=1 Tax=Drosophila persimilis TaxID=7234 RepID=UPI000F080D62|nr:vesicle-associated membrane protein/synaptobrevin-binding protein [Drosophila persimilis]